MPAYIDERRRAELQMQRDAEAEAAQASASVPPNPLAAKASPNAAAPIYMPEPMHVTTNETTPVAFVASSTKSLATIVAEFQSDINARISKLMKDIGA